MTIEISEFFAGYLVGCIVCMLVGVIIESLRK